MAERQYKRGDVIFSEGEYDASMFEITQGTVGVFLAYGKENEKKLTELGPGRIFGEMGLIEYRPRSATVVALSDVKARQINSQEMMAYFEEQPNRILEIMRGQARRLRELTEDYEEVCRTLGSWDKPEERKGLLGILRKFAEIYNESMKGNTRRSVDEAKSRGTQTEEGKA